MKDLRQRALEILEDDDIFANCCEELDAWDGFLGDDRLYPMWELDELHYGMSLSDFLSRVDFKHFDLSDEFWHYEGGQLVSLNGTRGEYYGNLYYDTDILDMLIMNYGNLDIAWFSLELNDIVKKLANEDEEQ